MSIDYQSNKISVLMSVYNDEKRVSKSIESILNQTFQDFEFLILDDCSTDNTYKICENYAKKNQKIKLMKNEENLGLTKSLNLLIGESNYELIARQDSDDESFKERLETQLNIMEKHNLDACTTLAKIDELIAVVNSKDYEPVLAIDGRKVGQATARKRGPKGMGD